MNRINVLWALPVVLPFAFIAMIRLLWSMVGAPWEPDTYDASFLVALAVTFSVASAAGVLSMQADGEGIWWTFKREKSDE